MRNPIEKSRAIHPANQHAFGERIPWVNTDAGLYAGLRRQAVHTAWQMRTNDLVRFTNPKSPQFIRDDHERADAEIYFGARYLDQVVNALVAEAQGMAINHPNSSVAQSGSFLLKIKAITAPFAVGAGDMSSATVRADAKRTKDRETKALLATLKGKELAEAKALLEEPSTGRILSRRALLTTAAIGIVAVGATAWGITHHGGNLESFSPPSQSTTEPGNPNVLEYQSLIGADPQTMVQDFGGDAANWIYIPGKRSWSYDGAFSPNGGILQIPHGALAIVSDDQGHAYYVIGGQQGTTIQEGTINSFSMFSVDWVMANQPNLQINPALENGYGSWAPVDSASKAPKFPYEPISGPNVQVPANF